MKHVKHTVTLTRKVARGSHEPRRIQIEVVIEDQPGCAPYRTIDLEQLDPDAPQPRLSICAEIWFGRDRTAKAFGQCRDDVARFFGRRAAVRELLELWDDCHLNDLHAGTRDQEECLRRHPPVEPFWPSERDHYAQSLEILRGAGLEVQYGYRYGTAWLSEALPPDIYAHVAAVCERVRREEEGLPNG